MLVFTSYVFIHGHHMPMPLYWHWVAFVPSVKLMNGSTDYKMSPEPDWPPSLLMTKGTFKKKKRKGFLVKRKEMKSHVFVSLSDALLKFKSKRHSLKNLDLPIMKIITLYYLKIEPRLMSLGRRIYGSSVFKQKITVFFFFPKLKIMFCRQDVLNNPFTAQLTLTS